MSSPGSAKTTVYLLRHGETVWNLQKRMQGHGDSPLTPTGIAQARAAAARLRGVALDAAYCSDLGRAVQTATILCEPHGLTPISNSGLRERNMGIMEGLTLEQAQERYPQELATFSWENGTMPIPGGESALERSQRCIATFESIVNQNTGKTILVVTHGGVLKSLFLHAAGLPHDAPRTFSLRNCAVNVLSKRDNRWLIETWGETSFLTAVSLDDA